LIVTLFGGCATHIPVQRENANLNLNYQSSIQDALTGKVIAIVSPEFVRDNEVASMKQAGQPGMMPNPYLMSLMAGAQTFQKPYANATFQREYQSRLRSAMQGSIEELLSKRGFNTKGPFSTLDDITYGDKKGMYLLSVPKITLFFDEKITRQDCKNRGLVCTVEGDFTITGELLYRLIEPLTGQALLTKRIDLSSLNISKTYHKEFQARNNSNGLDGALIDKAVAPDSLHDNSDRVLVEATNEFFQKAMAKIDSLLSREEMLSFEKDIEQLKSSKRF
jgi:neuraminyllactose-binding hemagglutinin